MIKQRIQDIYNCKYIENDGNLYPLQKWYNELLDKTVDELSISDLLKMFRQKMFLELAIAKSFSLLQSNPFEGELYDGELLEKLVHLDPQLLVERKKELLAISTTAKNRNQTYEWVLERERLEFLEVIQILDKIIISIDN